MWRREGDAGVRLNCVHSLTAPRAALGDSKNNEEWRHGLDDSVSLFEEWIKYGYVLEYAPESGGGHFAPCCSAHMRR